MNLNRNPEDRAVRVDNAELVLGVTLACEPIDPETVLHLYW